MENQNFNHTIYIVFEIKFCVGNLVEKAKSLNLCKEMWNLQSRN